MVSRIVLLLYMIFLVQPAFGGDQLDRVKVSICHLKQCLLLEASTAYRSELDSEVLSFVEGEIHWFSNEAGQESLGKFLVEDGYIDMRQKSLVGRGLKNSDYNEILILLERGQAHYF